MRSVYLDDGRPLWLSPDDYLEKVVKQKGCFLCGVSEGDADFNREHVIPDWVLKLCNMRERVVTKSSGVTSIYSRHKIPCCIRCNSYLSRHVEIPVSNLLKQHPADALSAFHNDRQTRTMLFGWMALLAYKSLHSDLFANYYDKEQAALTKLGDAYHWRDHHHLNSLCRLAYEECDIDEAALGSFRLLAFPEAQDPLSHESFDFATLFEPASVFIRIKRIGLIALFDDIGAALAVFDGTFVFPEAKGSPRYRSIDAREMLAELSTINRFLEGRPLFHTKINGSGEESCVFAQPGWPMQVAFDPSDTDHREERLSRLRRVYQDYKRYIAPERHDALDNGHISFLKEIGFRTGSA